MSTEVSAPRPVEALDGFSNPPESTRARSRHNSHVDDWPRSSRPSHLYGGAIVAGASATVMLVTTVVLLALGY